LFTDVEIATNAAWFSDRCIGPGNVILRTQEVLHEQEEKEGAIAE
jgi:hypothetical protein